MSPPEATVDGALLASDRSAASPQVTVEDALSELLEGIGSDSLPAMLPVLLIVLSHAGPKTVKAMVKPEDVPEESVNGPHSTLPPT